MILVKTHIEADMRSEKSGFTYPRELLDKMTSSEIEAPGAFNIDIDKMELGDAVDWITAKNQFTLIGFDLIGDFLYLKIEADEAVSDRIQSDDYLSRLIIVGDFEEHNGERILTSVEEIRGVVLALSKRG